MKINQIDENILSSVKYIMYFNYTQDYYAVDSFLELVRDLRPDWPDISEEDDDGDGDEDEAEATKQSAAVREQQQMIMAELAANFVQEYEFHSILAGTSELTLKPTATNPLIKLVSSVGYSDSDETAQPERLVVTSQNWTEFIPKLAQTARLGSVGSPTEYVLVLPVAAEEIFFQMLNLVGVLVIHDLTKTRPAATR